MGKDSVCGNDSFTYHGLSFSYLTVCYNYYMSSDIDRIIQSSTYKIHPGLYIYGKAAEPPSLDDCFMISRDEDEITAVVEQAKLDRVKLTERNKDLRKLIEINVSVPFYAVGFLAAVSNAIASKGANCLIVSTYSKDYVLVTKQHFEVAKQALNEHGFKETK